MATAEKLAPKTLQQAHLVTQVQDVPELKTKSRYRSRLWLTIKGGWRCAKRCCGCGWSWGGRGRYYVNLRVALLREQKQMLMVDCVPAEIIYYFRKTHEGTLFTVTNI